MLNVSSEAGGIGSGVLLRALEPMFGVGHMQRNASHVKLSDLTRGPGRLAAALGVNLTHDGLNLFTDKQLWIGSDGHKIESVGESVRIGLTKAAEERAAALQQLTEVLCAQRGLSVPRV
jgi:DNA-3-methyladenine glycosylase